MPSRSLKVSEARHLSALVERVARGGRPVHIGRYGRERAVPGSAEHYARLRRAVKVEAPQRRTSEGSMELLCSPAELVEERGWG